MNISILLVCSLSIHALKISQNKPKPTNINRDAQDIDPYTQFLANNLCGCYTEGADKSSDWKDLSKCIDKSERFSLPEQISFFQKYSHFPRSNTRFENSWEYWQQQQQQLWNTAMQLRNAQLQTFHGTRQQKKKHEHKTTQQRQKHDHTEIEKQELPFTCTIDDSIKETLGEVYVLASNEENVVYARERGAQNISQYKCLNFILAESSGVSMEEIHDWFSLKESLDAEGSKTKQSKTELDTVLNLPKIKQDTSEGIISITAGGATSAAISNAELDVPWSSCMETAIKSWQQVIDQRGVLGSKALSLPTDPLKADSYYQRWVYDNNRRCAIWLDMVSKRKVAKCCSASDYKGCANMEGEEVEPLTKKK